MIDFKDRIPTYPGRVTLTPVVGETNKYDMVRADEPIEPGTIINKALMASIAKETNLLDNWDFRKPVNQRGLTTYTTLGYNIDRWYSTSTVDYLSLEIKSGYVQLKKPNALYNPGWLQVIENQSLIGKTVTLTIKYRGSFSQSNTANLMISGANTVQLPSPVSTTEFQTYSTTGTISLGDFGSFVNVLYVGVQFRAGMTTSEYIDIESMKLELGSVSTLANDSPMNYQQEYLKCLRYFYKGSVQYLWAIADIDSYSSATYFRMMFPIPMRIIPTIIIPGRTIVTNGSYTPLITKEGIYLVGTTSGIPDTQGGWLDIEASADL